MRRWILKNLGIGVCSASGLFAAISIDEYMKGSKLVRDISSLVVCLIISLASIGIGWGIYHLGTRKQGDAGSEQPEKPMLYESNFTLWFACFWSVLVICLGLVYLVVKVVK